MNRTKEDWTVQRFPCGCAVEHVGGSFKIIYCPKHKAAPQLYQALCDLMKEADCLNNEECEHDVGICWCSYKNAHWAAVKALHKAEGREE
jgi:hypothetical protein